MKIILIIAIIAIIIIIWIIIKWRAKPITRARDTTALSKSQDDKLQSQLGLGVYIKANLGSTGNIPDDF